MLRLTREAHQPSCTIPVIASLVGVWLVTTALTSPATANAQDLASKTSIYDFEIPAQDLTRALRTYARVSGQQMAYDALDLVNKTSHAVQGQLSAQQGLDILLSGTGLNAKMLNSGTFLIATDRHSDTAPIQATLPQLAPAPIPKTPPVEVVVYGIRASLRSATTLKKTAAEVRDSIVAEDIGKLPDYNLPEALQRVSGIQIGRDHGEGNSVTIRGLTQVKTLINGREIFSDIGRDLAFEYVPTEIFSNVDVYKNPAASMVEGGVGGVINLTTHYPFDFKDRAASLSLRTNTYDMVKETKPQVSGLVSTRFQTGAGEVGLLFTLADIRSANRLDSIDVEPFLNRYNLVDFNKNGYFPGTAPPAAGSDPGDLVIAPNGGGSTLEITERHRVSADAVAQWRPNDATEFTLELTRVAYAYKRNAEVVYANRGPLPPQPGAVFTFADGVADDANIIQSGTYTNVAFSSNTNYFDRKAYTDQAAISGKWRLTPLLKLSGDLAYTRSARNDANGNIRIGNYATATGPTLRFDLRGKLPDLELGGFNFADPSQYHLIDASHSIGRGKGSGLAASLDATQGFTSGPIKSLTVGVRYADHSISNQQGTRLHMTGDQPISNLPEAASPLLTDDFYNNAPHGQLLPAGILGAPFGLLRDKLRICQALGDMVCNPVYNPLNAYAADENTLALYSEMTFDGRLGSIPVSGNIGGRYLDTQLAISGYRTSNTAQSQPIDQRTHYNNFLPSFNARLALTDTLILRLAAAKQVTRPSFQDLAPNLTISVAAFTTLVGRAGNPDLRPLHSSSYDASLEYYFGPNSYAYFTLFKKNVEGFIQTVTQVEPVSFPDYPGFTTGQISRPQNGGRGVINGYETGVQSFLDFLPTPFDGLGLQANYTRVDSHTPGAIAGTSVPLVGLSKNSYNLVVYYEKGRVRGRIAYSYRDTYVDTIAGIGSGNLPIYARPFGSLDASIGYKINNHISVNFDAANLLRSQFGNYFGNTDRPRFYSVYDRRYSVVLRLTF